MVTAMALLGDGDRNGSISKVVTHFESESGDRSGDRSGHSNVMTEVVSEVVTVPTG